MVPRVRSFDRLCKDHRCVHYRAKPAHEKKRLRLVTKSQSKLRFWCVGVATFGLEILLIKKNMKQPRIDYCSEWSNVISFVSGIGLLDNFTTSEET